MIPLEEARLFVRQSLTVFAPVEVASADALGLVVAQRVVAREPVPGFANSSMDGYALRSEDTSSGSARLRVTASIMAGDVAPQALGVGEAMRIMTGAPVPDGADCVCMIEEIQSEPDGAHVGIPRSIARGENVRYPGEDVTVGQVLVEPGTELGPAELGVLASQGYNAVVVYPRPRVGVMSTGNELSDSGGPLHGGEIRDMNRPMLLASLRRSRFDAVDLGIVRDDLASITRAYESAIVSCDAVISTGGVSVGDVDHVKAVILELSAGRARWMQVAIKPGKPFTFGVAGDRAVPLFGLPGNPVSTLVGFELYVRPSLRLLAGHPSYDRPTVNAVLDCSLTRRRDGRTHLVHVALEYDDDGRVHITNSTRHGSHLVSAIMGANGLAWVPDGEGLEPGATVRTLMLGDVSLATTTSGEVA